MGELDCLEKLGFSTNEAKVYTTLLKYKLLNGYEVAKFSGVARASVYDVISRMVSKGFIIKVDGEPNYYKPLDYEKLIEKLRQESEFNIGRAEAVFQSISGEENRDDYVMNLVGSDKFISKAQILIDSARVEISLSVWDQEFSLFRDALIRAVDRGVKVYIFSFEDVRLEGAVVFSYRISDISNLFPYRRTTLIVDSDQCLVGENHSDRGIFIYTKNHSVVSLATDEMVLNIFWYQYMERHGLLKEENTSEDFLQMMLLLARRLGIDGNMTKNMMVFNFQKGECNCEEKKS